MTCRWLLVIMASAVAVTAARAAEPDPIPEDLIGVEILRLEVLGPDKGLWHLDYKDETAAGNGRYRALWHEDRGGEFVHGVREGIERDDLDRTVLKLAGWLRSTGRRIDPRDLPEATDHHIVALTYDVEVAREPHPDERDMPPETEVRSWSFAVEFPRRGLPKHIEQFQQLIEGLAPQKK